MGRRRTSDAPRNEPVSGAVEPLAAESAAAEGSTPSAPASEVLVRIRGLRFSRGENHIFDGVDIDICRGKVTAIMGPSGTGKTTLLKLISGQLHPQAGTIEVDGLDVHRLGRGDLYRLRTRMGMLFQTGALLTDLSVFDNVAYPLREHTRLPASMIRKLVLMKLEAVGLRGARDLMPSELSGGMARRVALARAIALDPLMIMYDEPFTGQDPISMGVLVTLIRQLNDASRLTSIVVSHDVKETAGIADHLYLIANGKVMAHGSPADVEAAKSPWVDQFMHGRPDGPVHFHYPAPRIEQDFFGE
jgi:phospholipid/cholesterol/gamma-HCH transport system ATP-binding protein